MATSSPPSTPATMKSSSGRADSTPASSPPAAAGSEMSDTDKMQQKKGANPLSATMEAEEKKMLAMREKDEQTRARKLEQEREQDIKGGKEVVDTKYKALEFLLSQSKLYSAIMLQQIQKQEEVTEAKTEKDRKRAVKREEKAEQAAQTQQRKSTRTAAGIQEADDTTTSTQTRRGRGRPTKLKKEESGKITDFLKKEDIEQKAGKGASIQEALDDEAAAAGEDSIKAGDIGVQNLRSAQQPALVTGGLMRKYQLEGLEWLKSLYENGLNGILADEMGLGKTLQTIAFLAFLREQGVNGPFLIAGPLSTTSNWVDEFRRWTPEVPVVLYHGSKAERETIRRKQLRNPGSKTFPVICTSYEICMNDRKFLAHYGWKFIIIDEGMFALPLPAQPLTRKSGCVVSDLRFSPTYPQVSHFILFTHPHCAPPLPRHADEAKVIA